MLGMSEFKRSVELVLVRESAEGKQVLMSQRGPKKHGAGTFALPGGHIERLDAEDRMETLGEAAYRETTLELGAPLAEAVAKAFKLGIVAVVAVVDDLRQHDQYLHTALAIQVPDGLTPDPDAPEAWEHTDLRWRSMQEVSDLSASNKIYPPHIEQVKAFLADEARYAETTGLS